MIFWILIFLFLVFLMGLFAGSETGLISVDKIKLRKKAEEGDKAAKFVFNLLENIEDILTIVLIGTNICVIAISVLASNKFLPYFEHKFGKYYGELVMSGFIITPVMLLFSELLPKEIFRQKANVLVLKFSWFLNAIYKIFYLPAKIINKIISWFIPKKSKDDFFISKEEFEHLIDISDNSSDITIGEKEMLEGIIELSDTEVKEIMTPRINMIALDINSTVKDVIRCVEEHGYSRIPIYEEKIDNIRGFVFALDVIYKNNIKKDCSVKKYLREIVFVPESKKIDVLLKEMKARKEQIRIVIDEYSQVAGLVTLEDIIEEIVGEIHDEYDDDFEEDYVNKDGSIVTDAHTPIEELNEKYELDLPENDGYETLSGFLEDITGMIPKENQEITWQNYKFKILNMKENSIGKVLIIRNEQKA